MSGMLGNVYYIFFFDAQCSVDVFIRTMRILSSFTRLNKMAASETLFLMLQSQEWLFATRVVIKFVNTWLPWGIKVFSIFIIASVTFDDTERCHLLHPRWVTLLILVSRNRMYQDPFWRLIGDIHSHPYYISYIIVKIFVSYATLRQLVSHLCRHFCSKSLDPHYANDMLADVVLIHQIRR